MNATPEYLAELYAKLLKEAQLERDAALKDVRRLDWLQKHSLKVEGQVYATITRDTIDEAMRQ